MTSGPENGDVPERRVPTLPCTNCGGTTGLPMPIFDSRHGKTFNLFRCTGCNKLVWSEQK